MELFIGRQPILDINNKIVGYELLFRGGEDNYYSYHDGNEATLTVMGTALYHMGLDHLVGNKKAFINFTKDLLEQEFEKILPKAQCVIEVLEDVQLTDKVVEVCEKLKDNGFLVALDDVTSLDRCKPLMGYIDYVKVDWADTPHEEKARIAENMSKLGAEMLAEKIETDDDFRDAMKMGYTLFQGYYFSKPRILKTKAVPTRSAVGFELIKELNKEDFDTEQAADIIKREPGLVVSLLKFVNSSAMGFKERIKSLHQAVVLLGLSHLKRWIIAIVITQSCKNNLAAVSMAVERAKFCELCADLFGFEDDSEALFLIGLISLGETLLEQPMEDIIQMIGVGKRIGDTLMGENTEYTPILTLVEAQERGNWDVIDKILEENKISKEDYRRIYEEAIMWGNDGLLSG